MTSLTIENYVKAIYQLTVDEHAGPATTGALASHLRVSPSSVTSMLKTLHDSELAEHRPYEGVRLTDKGAKLALRVLRRHRLIELFLHRTLNLSWDEVHDEAEHMEHAVSDLLVDRMDEFLGYPAIDPHGDPIPKSDGTLAVTKHIPLSDLPPDSQFQVRRVLDQSPEFLRYLTETGLTIGTEGIVRSNSNASGTISISMGEASATLGHTSAAKLLVTLTSEGSPTCG